VHAEMRRSRLRKSASSTSCSRCVMQRPPAAAASRYGNFGTPVSAVPNKFHHIGVKKRQSAITRNHEFAPTLARQIDRQGGGQRSRGHHHRRSITYPSAIRAMHATGNIDRGLGLRRPGGCLSNVAALIDQRHRHRIQQKLSSRQAIKDLCGEAP
jgi:hypothetical protein